MKANDISDRERARLGVFGILMIPGFALLIVCLWNMQMGRGVHYEASLENQSVRRIRIPGIRGGIYDRRHVCLAENEPNYCIAIYLEEVRRSGGRGRVADETWKLVLQVADVIGREPEITIRQIENHLFSRRPLPLLAWQNIDEEALARFAESGSSLPAVDIIVKPARRYPLGRTACHILGYVGSVQTRDEHDENDAAHHHYLPDMAGRRGIERQYDRYLAGRAGGALVRIDATGFKHEELSRREPEFGEDLLLSIDLRIQALAEDAIADTVGAVVILDPRNGDVLAMASSPGFDLRAFYPVLSRSTWNDLIADPRLPLLNRAVSGHYAPGSVFKPIVSLAALEKGGINRRQEYMCEGYIQLGDHRFRCYREAAHGLIGFRESLELSCNVFFYKLGMECGYDLIRELADDMGFGRKTGIDIDYEASGLLPSREWQYRRTGRPWRVGDTCNVSIGQGSLLVTPLQIAVAAAAIANDGRVYEPRLVIGRRAPDERDFSKVAPVLQRKLEWSGQNLALIKEGMRSVIHEPRGTGQHARVPGVVMAGKTGTAQYGRPDEKRNHGWMMLYAPFHDPRYAVAMVMDDAVTGGTSVGPRIGRMMSEIFSMTGPESEGT